MKNTILAITFFIFGWSAPLSAEVMTYQGRLKESNVPVNANRAFLFELCATETPTGCVPSPDGAKPFAVQNGLFKSTFTIPAVDLSAGPWYLRVQVEGSYLSPVEKLTFVPYSLYASTAGYSPAALQKAGDTMTGQLTSISSVTITGNGGVYGLQVSSNVSLAGALYSANGNVGIGTTAPQYPLVVYGSPAGNIINAGDAANPSGDTAGFGLDAFATYPGAALYVNNAKVFNVESNGGAILGSTYMTADAVRNGLIVQGHVGIGTALPNYALEISSGGGEAGTIMSVSTGATNLFWVAGDGAHSLKFTGDGSGLTGVTGAAGTDSSKLPLTGGTLAGQLTLAGSTLTVTGDAFSVGGSTLVVINGNVGIGTTAPTLPLHVQRSDVNNGNNVMRVENTQASGYAALNYVTDSKSWNVGLAGSNAGGLQSKFYIHDGADFNVVVQDDGNVGIGTTNPAYRLVVSSGAGETGMIMAVSTGTTNIFSVDGSGVNALRFTGDGSGLTGVTGASGTDSSKLPLAGGTMSGPLTLAGSTLTVTGDAFSVGGSTLVVTGGYLGLGTNAPASRLHVVSDNGYVTFASPNTPLTMNMIPQTYAPAILNNNGDGPLGFSIANDVKMWIDRQTLVGIGTQTPAYRLHVSSAAGEAGTIMAVSTGTTNIFSVDGSGVNALKFTGDGSGLTGVTGASGTDSTRVLKAGDTMTGSLLMDAGSTITVTGSAFSVGGSTLVVSNGNVGIGTASPGRPLAIVTSAVIHQLQLTNTGTAGGYWDIGQSNSGFGSGGGSLVFTPDGVGSVNSVLVLKNAGNVGIGTTNPGAKLDVAGIIRSTSSIAPGDGAGFQSSRYMYDDSANYRTAFSSNVYAVGYASAAKYFGDGSGLTGVSGTDATKLPLGGGTLTGQLTSISSVTITGNGGPYGLQVSSNVSLAGALYSANGNVGIGTTGPVSRMDIKPSADNGASGLHIRSFNSDSKYISLWRGDNGGVIDVAGPAATPPPYLGITFDGTEKVRIDSGGNVGIGTMGPGNKLAISGSGATWTNGTDIGLYNTTNTNSAYAGLRFYQAVDAGVKETAQIRTTLQNGSQAFFNDQLEFLTATQNDASYTLMQRMVIDNLGNVGIGTTAPDQKLTVSGNISQTGLLISSGIGRNYFAGDVTAARYQIGGSTVLALLPGIGSMAVGPMAGAVSAGAYNLFIGSAAGKVNSSGLHNVLVGYGAGQNNLTGTGNTFIGSSAGSANSTGLQNIVIGYNQQTSASDSASELNIGGVLFGRLGEKAIGISTRAPQAALDVVSTGTAANVYAQIWRDGGGNVVSSVSSQGVFYGDGSGLTGVSGSDATKLPIAGGFMSGQLTNTSSVTITGNGGPYGLQVSSNVSLAGALYSANGNVGIGTTNPADIFEVAGSLGNIGIPTNGNSIRYTYNGANFIQADGALAELSIRTGGTDRMAIKAAGNIGIGTTAPATKFEVAGGSVTISGAEAGLLFEGPSRKIAPTTSVTEGAGLYVSTHVYIIGFSSAAKYYGDGSALTGVSGSDVTKLPIAGGFMSGQLTNTSSITITGNGGIYGLQVSSNVSMAGVLYSANGNVGIGRMSPMAVLDILGPVNFGDQTATGLKGNIRVQAADGAYPGVYNNAIMLGYFASETANNGATIGLGRLRGSYTAPAIVQNGDILGILNIQGWYGPGWASAADIYAMADGVWSAASTPTKLVFTVASSGSTTANNHAVMLIDNQGNVGISTSAPQARLDVLAGGSAQTDMAQIWRNSAGIIVSSVSATGVVTGSKFVGDGSGLIGISATDATKLPLGGGTLTGQLTLAGSSLTVTGAVAGQSYSANGIILFSSDGVKATNNLNPVSSITIAAGDGVTGGTPKAGGYVSILSGKAEGSGFPIDVGFGGDVRIFARKGANARGGDVLIKSGRTDGYASAGQRSVIDLDAGAYDKDVTDTTGGRVLIEAPVWPDGGGSGGTYQRGGHVTITGGNGTSGAGGNGAGGNIVLRPGTGPGGAGNVGISTGVPQARLDVLAGGSAQTDMAQLWRNSAGTIVSSVSATGVLMAGKFIGDGSGLNGVAATDATKLPLAGGTMAGDITMGGNDLYTVSTITATGDITAASYQIAGSTVLAVLPGSSLGVGVSAGRVNVGSSNLFLGYSAGYSNTAGNNNSFLGFQAGAANTSSSNNSFLGTYAGFNNTGDSNSFLGAFVGYNNTTGGSNSFLGSYAGYNTKAGSANAVFGTGAGMGVVNNSFSSSTIMGFRAGFGLTTGSDNILLGFQAGYTVTTGTGNIVIGYNKDTTAPAANNQLNIGGVLYGDLSAKLIGISKKIPEAALDIISTGTAANVYAQIWRDSLGVVVASMTATGRLSGDGSGLTGVAATDVTKLPLGGGTMSGQLTNTSSVTITGNGGGAYGLEVSSNVSLAGVLYSANGNVGIGGAAPGAKLDVYSFNTTSFLEVHNASIGSKKSFRVFQSNNHGLLDVFDTAETVAVRLNADNTSPSYINAGKVGIGITAPSRKLEVNGEITASRYEIGGSTVVAILSGTESLGIGINAGRVNTGNYNLFVGSAAGYSNTTGMNNSFLGISAGYWNTTASNNSFLGASAGYNNSGTDNSFMGSGAGYYNTGGTGNSFLGASAGYANNTGSQNSLLGVGAGLYNQTGSGDVILGYQAGGNGSGSVNSFSSSTVVGYQAGYLLRNGSADNILVGFKAGYSVTTGTGNIVIGYGKDTSAPGANNELNIGGVIYGNLAAGYVGVGAGVTNPGGALQVGQNGLIISTGGAIQTTGLGHGSTAGSARGVGAVDLQTFRTAVGQVASGLSSVLGGGYGNTSSADYTTVSGGQSNTATQYAATVSGGFQNSAGNNYASVSGGANNTATGFASSVSGGRANTASGDNSFVGGGGMDSIGGGGANIAQGKWSAVVGGNNNTASQIGAAVVGGEYNVAKGMNSFIGGGGNNVAAGWGSVAFGANSASMADYTFAAGKAATSAVNGTFTWADSSSEGAVNTVPDQVMFKAKGGFWVSTGTVYADPGLFVGANNNVGLGTTSPSVKFHNTGPAILANSKTIDPDSYGSSVIAGWINDVGYSASAAIGGMATNAGTTWAIGHDNAKLLFGAGDATNPNTLQTFMQVSANRDVVFAPVSGNVGIGVAVPGAKLDVAGDIRISMVGKGLRVMEGSNARMGTVALTAGTAIVSNTSVTASTRIFLTAQSGGAPGALYVSARTAGTSFTITSTNVADTSIVAWLLVEP